MKLFKFTKLYIYIYIYIIQNKNINFFTYNKIRKFKFILQSVFYRIIFK